MSGRRPVSRTKYYSNRNQKTWDDITKNIAAVNYVKKNYAGKNAIRLRAENPLNALTSSLKVAESRKRKRV